MARAMPSGTQLPRSWKKEHDRFICQCDALGDVEVRTIIRGLKKKFAADLGNVSEHIVPAYTHSAIYSSDADN